MITIVTIMIYLVIIQHSGDIGLTITFFQIQ